MIIHELERKTNFVDENNVLIGWDTAQDCCEYAHWWISQVEANDPTADGGSGHDLAPYRFDPSAFAEHSVEDAAEDDYSDVDRYIVFKMTAPNLPDLYLHLANAHNGYYSHGFNVDVGGKTIWEGSL